MACKEIALDFLLLKTMLTSSAASFGFHSSHSHLTPIIPSEIQIYYLLLQILTRSLNRMKHSSSCLNITSTSVRFPYRHSGNTNHCDHRTSRWTRGTWRPSRSRRTTWSWSSLLKRAKRQHQSNPKYQCQSAHILVIREWPLKFLII